MDELIPVGPENFADYLRSTYGVDFDGNAWMVMVPVDEPAETLFAAAVNPVTVKVTEHLPTGTEFMLLETRHGYVLRFQLILFDDPESPFALRQPLNPAWNAAGPHLAQLAAQKILRIIFFDALDGSFITIRHLPIDPDTRQTLQRIVELGKIHLSSVELWQAAVTAAASEL